jgi:hypothetical protein
VSVRNEWKHQAFDNDFRDGAHAGIPVFGWCSFEVVACLHFKDRMSTGGKGWLEK